jgi:AraC-like DNA-binding protein
MNPIIVHISIIGMFFSILLLFFNNGYKSANAYLAGFLFLSSLFTYIQLVFLFSHDLHLIVWFVAGLPSLFYLIGPFAYFYIRSILRDNTKLSKLDYLHFLIFFLVFLGAIPYISSNMEYKLKVASSIETNDWSSIKLRPNSIFPPLFNRTLRPIHLIVYSLTIWLTIYKNKVKIFKNKNHSKEFLITIRWLLVFSGLVSIMAIFHVIIFYNTTISPTKTVFILNNNVILTLFSVAFSLMITSLLFFPHILYGLPVNKILSTVNLSSENLPEMIEYIKKEDSEVDLQQPIVAAEKYMQLFSETYVEELKCKLTAWIDQKHYLNPEANISTLSVQIKIPQHHLVYYFNRLLGIKFTDWRNNLKIEYAKSLLHQEIYKSITMDALALKCGFVSQTTFNRAFKNNIEKTPSEYIKSIS